MGIISEVFWLGYVLDVRNKEIFRWEVIVRNVFGGAFVCALLLGSFVICNNLFIEEIVFILFILLSFCEVLDNKVFLKYFLIIK